jgi:tetrapyrrole methylase family protein/MazG family protein
MARDQGKEMKDIGLEGLQQMWKQAKKSSSKF